MFLDPGRDRRSVEHCGELLKHIQPEKTGPKLSNGADTEPGRMQAGQDAGFISPADGNGEPRRQRAEAKLVAPTDQFFRTGPVEAERGAGAVGRAYLLPPLSFGG